MSEKIKRTQIIQSDPWGPVVHVRYEVQRGPVRLVWNVAMCIDELSDPNVAMHQYVRWDAQALDQFAMWYANEGWGNPPTDFKR